MVAMVVRWCSEVLDELRKIRLNSSLDDEDILGYGFDFGEDEDYEDEDYYFGADYDNEDDYDFVGETESKYEEHENSCGSELERLELERLEEQQMLEQQQRLEEHRLEQKRLQKEFIEEYIREMRADTGHEDETTDKLEGQVDKEDAENKSIDDERAEEKTKIKEKNSKGSKKIRVGWKK